MFSPNIRATTIVTLVRFRSTMCVPPCEVGTKPIPLEAGLAPRVEQHEDDQRDRDDEVTKTSPACEY